MELLKIVIQDDGRPLSPRTPAGDSPRTTPSRVAAPSSSSRAPDPNPAASRPQAVPASPSAAAPSDDTDNWYPQFRELQNRQDMGNQLTRDEIAELKRLNDKLKEVSERLAPGKATPAAPASPVPAPAPSSSAPSSSAPNTIPKPPLAPASPVPAAPAGPKLPKPPPAPEFTLDDDSTTNTKTFVPQPSRGGIPQPPKSRPPVAAPVSPPAPAAPSVPISGPPPGPPPKPGPPPAAPSRPVATPISDAEASREKWTPSGALKDAKSYIPFGIGDKLGNKFETIGNAYKAGSGQAAAAGAGRAGAMAAGVGEAAVAAGPAAALIALEIAARVAAKGMDAAAKGIENQGRQAALLASNDHMGLFNNAIDTSVSALGEIPIVGKALASSMNLAAAPVRAFTAAVDGFVQRGKELSKYNSDLAAAGARSDVRRIQSDLKESQALGKELSRLTESQSQTDANLRELLLPIKEAIASLLAEVSDVGKEVTGIVKEFAPVIKFIVQVAAALPMEALKILGDVIRGIKEALKKWPFNLQFEDQNKGDLNQMMKDLFDSIQMQPAQAGGVVGGAARAFAPIMGGF